MRPADESTAIAEQQSSGSTGQLFWRAAGVTAGLVGAISIVLLAVVLAMNGTLGDILDQDQFSDRVDAINAVYRQGIQARETLGRSGTKLTSEAICEDAYHRVGADHERWLITRRAADGKPDEAFAELRRLSFINGCLGRPNALPATPLPSHLSQTPGR